MTAPTEAEIREAIHHEINRRHANHYGSMSLPVDEHLGEIVWNVGGVITDSDMALTRRGWVDDFSPNDDHPGTLWADLTAEETDDLRAITDAARKRWQAAALTLLAEELTAAGTEFADKHPDVPRGRYGRKAEPVTASAPTTSGHSGSASSTRLRSGRRRPTNTQAS